MKIASLNIPATERTHIESFGGLDRRDGRGGMVFPEMENMTGKHSPMLSSREKRCCISTNDGTIRDIFSADFRNISDGKIVRNALFVFGNTRINAYYGEGDAFAAHEIKRTSSFSENGDISSVSSGANIYFFPDKLYMSLMNYASLKYMECTAEYPLGAVGNYFYELSATPCDISGNTVSGSSSYMKLCRKAYFLTNGAKGSFYQNMAYNAGFAVGDTVKIKGLSTASLNGYYNIRAMDAARSYIVIECSTAFTQSTGTVYAERKLPDLDYVVAAGNRLWGCRYGLDEDGNSLNEIYASALGDPTNWRKYEGVSTDSWTASVGAPGAFTGAVAYNGHPIFFKENCIIKVFGDYPEEFSLSEIQLRGVEDGSSKSIVVANDTLYYKSTSGFVRYDGGVPKNIDAPLGNEKYKNAVCGVLNSQIYISARDSKGAYHLFVYDTLKDTWHREDSTKIVKFCNSCDDLFMLTDDGYVISANKSYYGGTAEDSITWSCVSKSIGYEFPEGKYVSSVNIRFEPELGSEVRIFIEYDRENRWHRVGAVYSNCGPIVNVPISPRRCDSFRIRLYGTGACKVRSMDISLEKGTAL